MQWKGGRRAHGRYRPFDGSGNRRCFGFALRDQHNATSSEHRCDSLRYAKLWNSFHVMVEKASVSLTCLHREGCDSSARGRRGEGFVEADPPRSPFRHRLADVTGLVREETVPKLWVILVGVKQRVRAMDLLDLTIGDGVD